MKTLVTSTGHALATGDAIETLADRLVSNGVEYPFAALGDGWQILDGAPPTPQHTWDGAQWVAPPAPPLDRAALVAKIDAAVKAIYEKPMSYSKEYEQREAQAQAYKDAGYTGTVPPRVKGFADPAGLSYQEAADRILSQAAQLRGALDQLSDLRMRKYVVSRRDPVTNEYVATDTEAQASADDTLAQVAQIAANLA